MLAFTDFFGQYLMALGRERILPRRLAATNRWGSPYVAVLAIGVVEAITITVYALAGWDPLVRLFFWIGTSGGYGILLLLTVACAAVIGYFIRRSTDDSVWARFIAPTLAGAALAYAS